ncbi:hypothetical protein N9L68_02230 [bacterium]|nr:hypothetical protein [bacterium]
MLSAFVDRRKMGRKKQPVEDGKGDAKPQPGKGRTKGSKQPLGDAQGMPLEHAKQTGRPLKQGSKQARAADGEVASAQGSKKARVADDGKDASDGTRDAGGRGADKGLEQGGTPLTASSSVSSSAEAWPPITTWPNALGKPTQVKIPAPVSEVGGSVKAPRPPLTINQLWARSAKTPSAPEAHGTNASAPGTPSSAHLSFEDLVAIELDKEGIDTAAGNLSSEAEGTEAAVPAAVKGITSAAGNASPEAANTEAAAPAAEKGITSAAGNASSEVAGTEAEAPNKEEQHHDLVRSLLMPWPGSAPKSVGEERPAPKSVDEQRPASKSVGEQKSFLESAGEQKPILFLGELGDVESDSETRAQRASAQGVGSAETEQLQRETAFGKSVLRAMHCERGAKGTTSAAGSRSSEVEGAEALPRRDASPEARGTEAAAPDDLVAAWCKRTSPEASPVGRGEPQWKARADANRAEALRRRMARTEAAGEEASAAAGAAVEETTDSVVEQLGLTALQGCVVDMGLAALQGCVADVGLTALQGCVADEERLR